MAIQGVGLKLLSVSKRWQIIYFRETLKFDYKRGNVEKKKVVCNDHFMSQPIYIIFENQYLNWKILCLFGRKMCIVFRFY